MIAHLAMAEERGADLKHHKMLSRNFSMVLVLVMAAGFVEMAPCENKTRPLVIVPGILGSVLSESRPNGQVVWGSVRSLFPNNLRKLDLLPPSGVPVDLVARDILRDFPLLFGRLSIGGYGNLLGFLSEDLGYREGDDLHVFYYDWRRSSFANAFLLSRFIDTKVGDRPYDLIAHSMGGIVARLMLGGGASDGVCERYKGNYPGVLNLSHKDLQTLCDIMYGLSSHTTNSHSASSTHEWPTDRYAGPYTAAKNLHTYIEMAVPHAGTNEIVAVFDVDEWGRLPRFFLNNKLRNIVASLPSLIELAPTYENCCAYGVEGAHGNRYLQPNELLSVPLWEDVVLRLDSASCTDRSCDLRRKLLVASLESRAAIKRHIDRGIPETVKYLAVFFGIRVGTRTIYFFDRNTTRITYRKTLDGDGKVAAASSKAPEQRPRGHEFAVPRKAHSFIFESKSVKEQLEAVILAPPDKWDIKVSEDLLTVAGAVVEGTLTELHPQIALPSEEILIHASVFADDGVGFDPVTINSETFYACVSRADSGVEVVQAELSVDKDSILGQGELVLTGSFEAPSFPDAFVVRTATNCERNIPSLGESILYIIEQG